MKNVLMFLVFVTIFLTLINFPVVSQGIHNSCRGDLVKIANLGENDIIPLTSCVTQSVAERFVELGWQVISPESNARLVTLSEEEARKITESIRKIFEEANEVIIEGE